jgi:hypothetical protein
MLLLCCCMHCKDKLLSPSKSATNTRSVNTIECSITVLSICPLYPNRILRPAFNCWQKHHLLLLTVFPLPSASCSSLMHLLPCHHAAARSRIQRTLFNQHTKCRFKHPKEMRLLTVLQGHSCMPKLVRGHAHTHTLIHLHVLTRTHAHTLA